MLDQFLLKAFSGHQGGLSVAVQSFLIPYVLPQPIIPALSATRAEYRRSHVCTANVLHVLHYLIMIYARELHLAIY